MEKVQLRVLRFVFNDFHASYSDLRSRGGRQLLYIKRLKAIATERKWSECIQMHPVSIIEVCQ